MPRTATLLLVLTLTACAGSAAEAPRAHGAELARTAEPTLEGAASRIGPPDARGLSRRRVDRTSLAQAIGARD